MIRPAWWLGALLVLSYVGMTSATAGPTDAPASAMRDAPPASAWEPPVWKPSLPSPAAPSPSLHRTQTASYAQPVELASSGIPLVTLNAYRSAAALIARSDPQCNLHWSLLAAIGRVESDHGRHGGSTITRDGGVAPPILGPQLNGAGVALISDSDGGRLDADTRFDRAVGPMQFLPGTWSAVGADGNDDGVADPANVYDAALGAGRYLCAGSVNLDDPAQLRTAVYRYNHSWSYVNLVLSLAEAYRNGGEPPGPVVAAGQPPKPVDGKLPPATTGRPPAAGSGKDSGTPPGASGRPPSDASGSPPSGTNSPSGRATPTGSPTGPSPSSSPDQPSTSPTPTPPTPSPPSPTPTPSSPTPTPTPTPTSPSPTPTPTPPTVAALSPAAGPVGPAETEVTITGSGLRKASAAFGGARAKTLSSGDGRLVVAAPARDRAGPVGVVVTRDGISSEAATFTYVPAISAVDPETAPPGATLTVSGTGFTKNSTATLTPAETSGGDGNQTATPKTNYDDGTLLVALPDELRPGPYLLAVTTNDAAGAPVRIEVTKP